MEKEIVLTEFYHIIAAKAAESFFLPALKRQGYQTPGSFSVLETSDQYSRRLG
jgi:hypothetical protein